MSISSGFEGAVGNTPLIRLERLSQATGCDILGKAEFMNPGGSVKDRAARAIVHEAEKSGRLGTGGTVVEGTAGNTGISLAHLCRSRGYRCVIVMPDNQSAEKYAILQALGVELERVPAVPYADPNHYQRVAKRRAEEITGAVWADQFDNTANRDGHYATTGPEIWRDTEGRLDAFVAASGTGGTFGGTATFLKERGGSSLRTVLADPQGSALFRWVRDGELKAEGPGSITEGIGIGRVTANLRDAPIDEALHVTDLEAVGMAHYLLREEGLFLGSAAGVNVAAAVRLARHMGPGHRIATILCDSGHKYQSRLYDRDWLAGKGLLAATESEP
ncbi:MAG: cysteine synthase A [Steroidobacteraceae bacterium]